MAVIIVPRRGKIRLMGEKEARKRFISSAPLFSSLLSHSWQKEGRANKTREWLAGGWKFSGRMLSLARSLVLVLTSSDKVWPQMKWGETWITPLQYPPRGEMEARIPRGIYASPPFSFFSFLDEALSKTICSSSPPFWADKTRLTFSHTEGEGKRACCSCSSRVSRAFLLLVCSSPRARKAPTTTRKRKTPTLLFRPCKGPTTYEQAHEDPFCVRGREREGKLIP